MNILIFNGSLDVEAFRTSRRIAQYYADRFAIQTNAVITQLHLSDYQIPFFDPRNTKIPENAQKFADAFTQSDVQIWLSPLYHGGMTGVMKNALDWLELTATNEPAYLTGKVIGLTCWSGGNQAMQGIQSMDNVVKALRGWSLPYQLPISNAQLYENNDIADFYKKKMDLLVDLLIESKK